MARPPQTDEHPRSPEITADQACGLAIQATTASRPISA